MSSLQNKVLNRYRQIFPQETLRETSARTGIQITRVHRLHSGKTMKVAELEAFEKAILDKMADNPSYQRLLSLVDEASAILTNSELEKVSEYISRKVTSRTFGRLYISHNIETASIA